MLSRPQILAILMTQGTALADSEPYVANVHQGDDRQDHRQIGVDRVDEECGYLGRRPAGPQDTVITHQAFGR